MPGERALGSYALDIVMDSVPVCLPPTFEVCPFHMNVVTYIGFFLGVQKLYSSS